MLVKTIEDKENGKKWEIFKESGNNYFYKYYEYFTQYGWIFVSQEGNSKNGYYTKNAIEWEFDIVI